MRSGTYTSTSSTLVFFTALLHLCHTYEVNLFFNSHNCDESPRRVSTDKEYMLTWLGQTEPKLCTFNFTGGGNDELYTDFKVCFKSDQVKLPSFDMKLVITANTKKLEYDGSTTIIEEICTDDAWNMMFKIDVTNFYRESSGYMVKLKIYAKKKDEIDEAIVVSTILGWLGNIVEIAIPIIIIAVIFCTLRHPAVRQKLRDLIGSVCNKVHREPSSSPRARRHSSIDQTSVPLADPHQIELTHSDATQNDTSRFSDTSSLASSTEHIVLHMSTDGTNPPDITAPPPRYEDVVDSSNIKQV